MSEQLNPHQKSAETKRRRSRAALLDAAEAAFSADGWPARMEDIAKRASVGVATAYNHFPSKVDLIMHVFARVMEPFQEKVDQGIIANVEPIFATTQYITEIACTLKESHKSITAAYLAAVADSASAGSIPMTFVLDHEMKRALTPTTPEKPLANLIDYGQSVGIFRPDVSAWAIGSYHTYALLWLVSRGIVAPIQEGAKYYESNLVLSQLLPILKLEKG